MRLALKFFVGFTLVLGLVGLAAFSSLEKVFVPVWIVLFIELIDSFEGWRVSRCNSNDLV